VNAQVEFLGALFVIWGALTSLIGVSTLALAAGAVALITSPNRHSGHVAAGLTAVIFATLGVIAVVWGAAHMAVGFPLRRRRHWSRLAALMLGAVDLALLPYGTVLGAYSLWVLLREDAKKLFA
jgi:hypothetical protein